VVPEETKSLGPPAGQHPSKSVGKDREILHSQNGGAFPFPPQKINERAHFISLGGLICRQHLEQWQNKVGARQVVAIFIVKHFDLFSFKGPTHLAITVRTILWGMCTVQERDL
jgi:hypothetical protein